MVPLRTTMSSVALKTAALAEPDRLLQVTFSEILEGEGWTLVAAGAAPDVLKRLSAKPGLALVDMSHTHEADAFCVGMRIRFGPHVPIVGITRGPSAHLQRAAPGAIPGPTDVLQVPFVVSRLQELLHKVEDLQAHNRVLLARSDEAVAHLRSVRHALHFDP